MTRNPFPGRGVAAALLTALLLCGGLATTPAAAAAPTLSPTTTAPTGAIPTPGPLDTLTSSASASASTAARTYAAAPLSSPRPSTQVPRPTGASGPQLSIAVDNGRTSAAPGQVLDYVLTLTNLGSSEVKGLRVTQSVPTGLTLLKADGGGRATAGTVGWKVDLRAAKATTFHVTMKVSATPKDLLRLATVACASLSAKTSPIVCASHSDQLPAGAAAAAASSSAAKPTAALASRPVAVASHGWRNAIIGVVAAGVLVVLLLTLLVIRQRRRTTPVD